MDKLIENYRELFRTLNRLHNTNKGLLLKGDIERLERARGILNTQQIDERRVIPSDENGGLHKHVVNGCAFLEDIKSARNDALSRKIEMKNMGLSAKAEQGQLDALNWVIEKIEHCR